MGRGNKTMSPSSTNAPEPPETPRTERRGFLRWITYLAGAAAALVLVIPLVGYLLGAFRKVQAKSIQLGRLDEFPPKQTRLVTFNNELGQPWDGMAAYMGVYVRNLG